MEWLIEVPMGDIMRDLASTGISPITAVHWIGRSARLEHRPVLHTSLRGFTLTAGLLCAPMGISTSSTVEMGARLWGEGSQQAREDELPTGNKDRYSKRARHKGVFCTVRYRSNECPDRWEHGKHTAEGAAVAQYEIKGAACTMQLQKSVGKQRCMRRRGPDRQLQRRMPVSAFCQQFVPTPHLGLGHVKCKALLGAVRVAEGGLEGEVQVVVR